MEPAQCVHSEIIKNAPDGISVGTCSRCGQIVQYSLENKDMPTVTKLGRINGQLVLPAPKLKLLLDERDKTDLDLAKVVIGELPGSLQEAIQSVPPKPKSRKRKAAYWEQAREALLNDYRTMKLREFLKKWHLATSSWQKLKKLWGVEGKIRVPTIGDYRRKGQKPGTALYDPEMLKLPSEYKEAEIKVSHVIKKVTHVCYCSLPAFDTFEGEVVGLNIIWPVFNGKYRMSYCPWCGLHLPDNLK